MAILNFFCRRCTFVASFTSFLFMLYSKSSYAHVTWFVADEGIYANTRFTLDPLSLLIAIGAVAFLLFAARVETLSRTKQSQSFLYRHWIDGGYVYTAIQISIAVLFLGNIIQGHFIAPNIPVDHHSLIEPFVQASLIILIILNREVFSIAIFGLCISLIHFYGLNLAIDYVFELAAIAAALIFASPNSFVLNNKYLAKLLGLNCALTALRIGLGLQLCILTIHDKLSHPGLALQFLADYPYFNFIQYAGLEDFKDIHFVLGAGLAEFCFGLLLLTNIAQRLSSLCICFFFGLSGIVLGPAELLGHVPILTMAVVLLLNPAPCLRSLTQEVYRLERPLLANQGISEKFGQDDKNLT